MTLLVIPFVSLREIRIEFSMIGFLAIEMSILKYSDNSLINRNTIQVLKTCIQIDFSEYTRFMNTSREINTCQLIGVKPTYCPIGDIFNFYI